MARPKKTAARITAARLTLEDFRTLGVRPHEFRSIVIRQAAVRKTRDLAKRQLESPSDQVGLQLARIATTTYRLLDPRLRDESAHSAYVGRILPQVLSWASRTSFSREFSQFGSVPRGSDLSPFEPSSLSDAELIEMLDLDAPQPLGQRRSRKNRPSRSRPSRSRRSRSRQVDVSDWTASLSDADLLRPRRLKKWHARAGGLLVVTAASLAFGLGGAAVYRWLNVGRDIIGRDIVGRDIARRDTIVQSAVPSVGLAREGQSLGEQSLDPPTSIDAQGAPPQLSAAVLAETARGLLSKDGPVDDRPVGDAQADDRQIAGQAVAETVSPEIGREEKRSHDQLAGSSLTLAERVDATTPQEPGEGTAIVATDSTKAGNRESSRGESSRGGRFDSNESPRVLAAADPELEDAVEVGLESMASPVPELDDYQESREGMTWLEELPEIEDSQEILGLGLAAEPGLLPAQIDVPIVDEAANDEDAKDEAAGVVTADWQQEEGLGGEIITREPEPSDDSLWLARLELLRWMPNLDVPFEAKNAHLRILELELEGRKFRRNPAVYWVLQTLIAEAAWLVETVDEVEQRLGVLTTRYRVSPGKLLADTFVSASRNAAVPSTRDHLLQNGLRLCDKLLVSAEPEYCKSVLEVLDGLLPSAPDEAKRSSAYLRDYLSAADEMIRYREGEEVRSYLSPMEQGDALGRYDCLLRRDWEKGLPGLVESFDESIARAAQAELALADASEAIELKMVADQWLVAASEATGRPADSMRLHAVDLLRKARERSSGLLTSEIDRQMDRLIEIVPKHLLPADDWSPSRGGDPNSRRNRPTRRTAPVGFGQAL